ncbi:MAG TPA: hypothetical protein VK701_04785, partial [Solirubrobacteraceae bacterium]|nr:hypothetical protein [Solirubrobacteraceae bacterium]
MKSSWNGVFGLLRREMSQALPIFIYGASKQQRRTPMSYANINRVVFVGRLTSDPELRALPSGSN